jgi:adenylate cyclase class IV
VCIKKQREQDGATRFNESFLTYKNQNLNSNFAEHLQEYHHSIGHIEKANNILQVVTERQLYGCLK